MELNIKVWKPIPKLKSQQRQFVMVNDQWLIDNADLVRNGGFEIDETFEQNIEPVKEVEIQKEIFPGHNESDSIEESQEPLFEFDKSKEEKVLKPKTSKK